MATREAIAIMRETATRRLTQAMAVIGEKANVEAAKLDLFDRDPDYRHAAQLEAISEWADTVAAQLNAPAPEGDFSDDDLLNLAAALAMNPPADVQRADLVQLIRAEVTPLADDAATATTEAPAASPYASLTKAELQALADERKLVVTGTGAQGNVLVDDLRAALDADDAAQAEGE